MVARGFKLGAKLDVVVDFAVEDQPERAVFVGHGLEAGVGQVDNAQVAVGKADRPLVEVEALAVGAAMGDSSGHERQHLPVGGCPSVLYMPAMPHIEIVYPGGGPAGETRRWGYGG